MTSSLSFFEHNLQKSIISRGTIKTSQFDLNKACSMVVLLSWRLHRYPLKQLSLEGVVKRVTKVITLVK